MNARTPNHPADPPLWMADDVAAAVNGRLSGHPWRAFGVSIDSRTVQPGDLFVALQGPNFDGHAFVADALGRGAAAAMIHQRPEGLPADAPLLTVADTFTGLQDLGRVGRLRSTARIAAVTGSVGKTSTKEALRACLDALAPTFATQGSLNNHWGVPRSLARLPADAAYGVFELGMNHAGEIGPLSRQVRPDVAVITTVEAVHLEHFPSVEAIADAKAEIFEGMTHEGTAVLNRDNPHHARLVAAARTQGLGRIVTFGTHEQADARLLDCTLHAAHSEVTASVLGQRLDYRLAWPGRHHVMNSLAVLLAVSALQGDVARAALALGQLDALKGRGLRKRVRLDRDTAFTVIDESYNASPASVAASVAVLGRNEPEPGGRRIAVLGDMLELGPASPELHAGLADAIRRAELDLVFCCGPNMKHLFDALPAALRGGWAKDSAALAPVIGEAVRAGDVVMIKGSLGSRMARVVEALANLDRPVEDTDTAASAAKQS